MERRERFSKSAVLIFVIFCVSFVWVLLQLLAPIALPTGSVHNLSGLTMVSDNEKCFDNMSFPWNAVYSIGDRMCHQKAERSLFLNENQMPFCSRCTAIWIGIPIGLLFLLYFRFIPDKKLIYLIIISVMPIGIDGVGQMIGLWESTNLIRFLTGSLAGIACGISVGVISDELLESSLAKRTKNGQ